MSLYNILCCCVQSISINNNAIWWIESYYYVYINIRNSRFQFPELYCNTLHRIRIAFANFELYVYTYHEVTTKLFETGLKKNKNNTFWPEPSTDYRHTTAPQDEHLLTDCAEDCARLYKRDLSSYRAACR